MNHQIQREKLAARIVIVVLLILGIGTTVWTAKVPDSGLSLAGSILAISMCYFFAGWAFGIYLSLNRDQTTEEH